MIDAFAVCMMLTLHFYPEKPKYWVFRGALRTRSQLGA